MRALVHHSAHMNDADEAARQAHEAVIYARRDAAVIARDKDVATRHLDLGYGGGQYEPEKSRQLRSVPGTAACCFVFCFTASALLAQRTSANVCRLCPPPPPSLIRVTQARACTERPSHAHVLQHHSITPA